MVMILVTLRLRGVGDPRIVNCRRMGLYGCGW